MQSPSPPRPRMKGIELPHKWLTTHWHAANVTAIIQSRQWLREGRLVLWGLGPRHDTADFQLNFRAVSCCFIRERLSTSVAFMAFISRGITAESETHYRGIRGITALFSWFVPIPAVTTVVTAALLWLQSPCRPLLVTVSQYPGCGHSLACGECDRDLKGFS